MKITGSNLSMIRGDSESITVRMKNAGGPVPFEAGDAVYFTVKESPADSLPLLQKEVRAFGSGGEAVIELAPGDTSGLDFLRYCYDIQLTRADGRVLTLVPSSSFTLRAEITLEGGQNTASGASGELTVALEAGGAEVTVEITGTGPRGQSAWEAARAYGYTGTEAQFGALLATLGAGGGSPVLPYPDRASFPAAGSENALYIDLADRRCYCWSGESRSYLAVGSDYGQIECISGGGAG
ncbi:hypothetical protein H8711_10880 [Clostridiaceae bacterium NSJ-31]|uniref:Uncharacterized protein n=1 Tax=Ligaoa zhengdingensis TaxID=2763658 RepID=A0A926I4I0_9FIRM|nr:hypothetical protein [Ligaoa zhengdingensis]MBC8547429.1 hypothetical protein [Ligaoa zhengdingensis]